MDRRILDIVFVAAVVVLSYVASVHLITNRVVEKIQASTQFERGYARGAARAPVLSGPVALRPIVTQRTAARPVIQRAKPVYKERIKKRTPASVKKHVKKPKHKFLKKRKKSK